MKRTDERGRRGDVRNGNEEKVIRQNGQERKHNTGQVNRCGTLSTYPDQNPDINVGDFPTGPNCSTQYNALGGHTDYY